MEETSWLIELEGPKWAGFVDGKPEWTTDPNRALRFARKEDADNFKAFWCATATSTEHDWPTDEQERKEQEAEFFNGA